MKAGPNVMHMYSDGMDAAILYGLKPMEELIQPIQKVARVSGKPLMAASLYPDLDLIPLMSAAMLSY